MRSRKHRLLPILTLWTALGLLSFGSPATAATGYEEPGYGSEGGYDSSYGYLRVIDGSLTLIETGSYDRSQGEVNQPVLAGDRLLLGHRSRAEVVLPDRNLLRLDGDTELLLEALAASPDSGDRQTVLRLLAGTLQVVMVEARLGDEPLRIDTANATVYLHQAGSYLVSADRTESSLVVVRRGYAEVLTPHGSVVVRSDEQAVVEGRDWARAALSAAGRWDPLERWGEELERAVSRRDLRYVDDSLRYAAAPLSDHGSWVYVDHRPAWRPRVTVGWSPYSHGRWRHTSLGFTWVSYEPWGWVPYHYGTWDYVGGYGWVWYPGRVFSPAWVYWYWTPTYVGWCPVGYYTHHYYPRYRHGFRFGVYGWAGGGWDVFAHWNFLPTHRLRHRDQARWVRPSYALRRDLRVDRLPRGILTTDTRGISQTDLTKPDRAVRALATRPAAGRVGGDRDLPDVSAFLARQELPQDVARQVTAARPGRDGGLATPLRPDLAGSETPAVASRPSARGDDPARGGVSPQLQRRPAQVSEPGSGTERPTARGPSITRRPAGAGERPATQAPTVQQRPAPGRDWRERPSAERPTVQQRPASPQPGANATQRPGVQQRPAPGRDWRERPSAERPTVQQRPASPQPGANATQRPSVQQRPTPGRDWRERPSTQRPSAAPQVERRPSPGRATGEQPALQRRPASPPAAGGSDRTRRPGEVRIERRPAPRPSSSARGAAGTDRFSPAPRGGQRPSSATQRPSPTYRPPTVERPGSTNRPPTVQRPGSTYRPPTVQRPGSRPSAGSSSRPAPSVRRPSSPSPRPGYRPTAPSPARPPQASAPGQSSGSSGRAAAPSRGGSSRGGAARSSAGSRGGSSTGDRSKGGGSRRSRTRPDG